MVSTDEPQAESPNRPNLIVPWRTVALVLLGLSVCGVTGMATALVLVASAESADALSTIALGLAVLAFTIQIIVFVAQVFAANNQTSRQEEIYARMNGLLEGLRGTAQGTQETLQQHLGLLLKAATGEARETLEETDGALQFDPKEFEHRVLDRLRADAAFRPAEALDGLAADVARHDITDEDYSAIQTLETFPSAEEDARVDLDLLERLTPWAVKTLLRFGDHERRRRRLGTTAGLRKTDDAPFTNELEEHGLVERYGPEGVRGGRLVRLTDKGRRVARMVTAEGKPPDWLKERQAGLAGARA